MEQSDFDGEFWNTDENTKHITRLRFGRRGDEQYVCAWGACFPEDCEWGETKLTRLLSCSELDRAVDGFATWSCETGVTHCLMKLAGGVLTSVTVAIRSDMPSYRTSATFRKDAAKSAEALNFDPLVKFKRMWDGSEPGWKLIRYPEEVFLVEFHFDESGPNDSEFQAVLEFVGTLPTETPERARERLRGCDGIGLAKPFTKAELEKLEARRQEFDLKLTIDIIATDDYLTLTPSGLPFNWIPLRRYRRPVIQRMLAAGAPIVSA